jgi:hemolysin III
VTTATAGEQAVARPRPILRGASHLVAAALAPAGLVALLLLADSPRAYVGAAVFASCLIAVYATSASYHLVPWPDRLRGVMKRLDHSMIFALIAGSYTPFCLLVLSNAWGISMLSVVWGVAGAGILLKVLWPHAPRWLSVGLYLGVGWLAIVATPEIVGKMAPAELAALALGGAMYSIGGVIYAMARPNPWPRIFGYHEIFHLFVIAGSAIHFGLVAWLVVG